MSTSEPPQPLNTAALHRAALSSLSLPPQPQPPSPLTPPPSTLPHSKLIPKTRFIIDGFKHANPNFSVSYFLSHFHCDHYTGLTPQWAKGIIYCSSITANLLHLILKIPQPFIYPLPLSQTIVIDGSEVSLIDANHCPGAVQFLFKVPVDRDNSSGNGTVVKFEKYVHTGDFRYCDEMKSESLMSEFVGCDGLFLDTTYCNPKFVFPSQDESINYMVDVIERIGTEKNVLFLVATYVIGKERILLEISQRCKRKIHVSGKKMGVLRALGLGENGVFTEDESKSDVHVVGWNVLGETWPYFKPNFVKMKEIMSERGYSKVVGFVPTGWTYEVKRNKFSARTKDSFEIHLVPYSEHSNYNELREYVKLLKPKRVVPTVGADVEKIDSKHVVAMQKHFAGLVDEVAIKQEFLMGFLKQETGSCDLDEMKEIDLEKSLNELRECLPSWVTESQMKILVTESRGNVVDAVSNFYEHETEFHEQVQPNTCFSTFEASPDNQFALPFESSSIKSMNRADDVASSQSFKLSSPKNLKKSGNSPAKRKRNADSKATKKARVDPKSSSDSKQPSITKFFTKKVPVVSEDCKVDVDFAHSNDDNATKLYQEEVDQFIQIVNAGESLRSYAATILEKVKGDVNRAVDMYYNGNAGTSHENKDGLLYSNKLIESEFTSRMCSKEDGEISKSNEAEIRPDIHFTALPKDNLSGNFVSLPPERYSPVEHACWRKGQPSPYIHIARTFDLVEEEKGKIKATSMLCNMFRRSVSWAFVLSFVVIVSVFGFGVMGLSV